MKLLLDTHVLLWLVDGSPNLSSNAEAALASPANELFLSVASVWELAIKTSPPRRQLVLSDPLNVDIPRWTQAYRITELTIRTPHALRLAELPEHHRDPFDRILIAQAEVEGMVLVSADGKFASYSVPILW